MANEKWLIDADVVLDGIIDQLEIEWGYEGIREDVKRIFENAPTVDAVEVVRCKDCKYGIWSEKEQLWQCVYSAELDDEIGEYFGFTEYNKGEHFCSYGERREGE